MKPTATPTMLSDLDLAELRLAVERVERRAVELRAFQLEVDRAQRALFDVRADLGKVQARLADTYQMKGASVELADGTIQRAPALAVVPPEESHA